MQRIGSAPTPTLTVGHWTEHAACSPEDAAMFFPEGSPTAVKASTADAKNLCGRCPVAEPCLQWALVNGEQWGTWGGLTFEERVELDPRSKLRRTGVGRLLAPCGTPAAYERHRRNGEPVDSACMANRTRRRRKGAAV